jgi:hypothetical protein
MPSSASLGRRIDPSCWWRTQTWKRLDLTGSQERYLVVFYEGLIPYCQICSDWMKRLRPSQAYVLEVSISVQHSRQIRKGCKIILSQFLTHSDQMVSSIPSGGLAPRIILTVVAILTVAGSFAADYNETHIYNPLWPGDSLHISYCL